MIPLHEVHDFLELAVGVFGASSSTVRFHPLGVLSNV